MAIDCLLLDSFAQLPDPSFFELPEACKAPYVRSPQTPVEKPICISIRHLVPYIVDGHMRYDAFLKRYARQQMLLIEYIRRLEIYLTSLDAIEKHNQDSDGIYSLEENRYTDWNHEEFFRYRTGGFGCLPVRSGHDSTVVVSGMAPDLDAIVDIVWEHIGANVEEEHPSMPDHFSWRGTPADTSVRDQGNCAAVYAFAASAAMTGSWWVTNNQFLEFAEQPLIDCTWEWDNMGCSGGRPELAFLGIIHQTPPPIARSLYPYLASEVSCRSTVYPSIGQFVNFNYIGRLDIDITISGLIEKGPLSVLVDASLWDFKFYKSRIYSNPLCVGHPEYSSHAVSLVSYSKERGKAYWLVKNSWGRDWGEDGNMKIDMDADCGVTRWPSTIEAQKQTNTPS